MAKQTATTQTPLQAMDADELKAKLAEFEEQRFRLKFRHASTPLKNPMEIRTARRQVARVKTILAQKTKGAV